MLFGVWDKYEPGPSEPDQPEVAPPAPYRPPLPDPLPRPYAPRPGVRAGGPRSSGGAGVVIAVVGMIAVVGIGVAASNGAASPEQEYSGWYDCIESYQDEEPGLLTPADFCEIGHEKPPGYSEYDGYDFDPFNPDQYDTWQDFEDGDSNYNYEFDF